MANIKEQQLYIDLLALFATIKTTNEYAAGKNYETNIGNFVRDWSDVPISDSETEVLILEDPEMNYAEQEEHSADHKVSHTFVLKLFLAKGEDTLDELRKAQRDLRRCLGANIAAFITKYHAIAFKPITIVKGFEKAERLRGGLVFRFTAEWSQEKWLIDEPEY